MKKHGTKIYLDIDIHEWLQKEAERLRCSVSEVVRRLALAKMSAQQKPRKKR
jgi:hypothetical protein